MSSKDGSKLLSEVDVFANLKKDELDDETDESSATPDDLPEVDELPFSKIDTLRASVTDGAFDDTSVGFVTPPPAKTIASLRRPTPPPTQIFSNPDFLRASEDWKFDMLLSDLLTCHTKAERGKRDTMNAMQFESFSIENLVHLAYTIYNRTYEPSRGIAFINFSPVMREIFAAPFRDRVVHHYIYEKTSAWWEKQFIRNTYSCIKGRGTLLAISDVAREMREASNNFTEEAYYIKLDLRGYFMSLDRKLVLREALKGLNQQYSEKDRGFEYDTLYFLWQQIVMDDPVRDAHFRNFPGDWRGLPKDKSLLNQPPGTGIVIGNLTSQELSNIYLNKLDWYITDTLGWKYYNRYVDDFVIIVNERDFPRAVADINRIENFLTDMKLTLHPKKREIQNIRHGLKFLGFTIYPNKVVPGKRLTKNAIRAAKQYSIGCRNGDSIISYLGQMEHFDCEALREIFCNILFADEEE